MTIRPKARNTLSVASCAALAIATVGPASAAESLHHGDTNTVGDMIGTMHQTQQPVVTQQRLDDGTLITTTTTSGPVYDPSVFVTDGGPMSPGVPAAQPAAPIAPATTQDGRYNGQWTGNYVGPDGRTYQGQWTGTYQDPQGNTLQGEYRGTYTGESRFTDANGNPVGVDFGNGAVPAAPTALPTAMPGYPGYQGYPGYPVQQTNSNLSYLTEQLEECRRDNGIGGALIGGGLGALAGNRIAGPGNRTAGTLIGAGVGAVAGMAIDQAEKNPCDDLERQVAAARQQQQQAAYNPYGGYPYGYGYGYPAYYYPPQTVTTIVIQPGSSAARTTYVQGGGYSSPNSKVVRRATKRIPR
ncbi:glycine zipper 2TM domain-containing protein [Alterisphingorhabdus coralli]|uniref:17 kDa surface antigen n=1 Tax=Alterisphingorhabdus coralli TaxID=3071408 RepID=A0AA97I1A4_9SPHN|nr:glycine zipper 2TM domain-containing protein [Parasphingorhabdus sp. SCSIO 66989]WOE75090.1 glycine zipper 2TM domain-containing protein [Parasphingorhabdus sp. SCSIO 66989]